ncbi:MAG: calcineurin, partial [Nannocystaceae bacterium]|nr:calcineurin [Nannocystaceae bacterium]
REFPEALRSRASAFLPGGAYAKVLATRNTAVVVGDTVFVHGGVLPKYASKLKALNEAGRLWLSEGGDPPAELLAPDGLVWLRDYSIPEPTAKACADLDVALAELKVSRMVVGHTVQARGVTSACEDKVWRIDVGMAEHYGGKPAALEIKGSQLTVLTESS